MLIDTKTPRSRRALLAGALGGIAGAIAGAFGKPSQAAAVAGSPLIVGSQTNNAGTSDTQLITNSNVVAFKAYQQGPGTALFGYSTPTTGATRAIYGRANSPNGFGIVGANNGGAPGDGAGIQAIGNYNHALLALADDPTKDAVRALNRAGGRAILASGNVKVTNGSIEIEELPNDPVAPSDHNARLYTRDNGVGKTQLVIRFPNGNITILATEP